MTPGIYVHLPPVSYEALEANNRHTHANLNFCIQQRELLREAMAEAMTSLATGPMKDGYAYAILDEALNETAHS